MNMEKLAKDLYTGVEGLQIFMDNFAGVDIFEEDQLAMLDIILAKADGFAAGVATMDELSKAAVVTSQPAPAAVPVPVEPAVPAVETPSSAPAPALEKKAAPSKNYPTLLLFHCKSCGKDHWRRIDGEETTALCNCGHAEKVRRADLTLIEYNCPECKKYSFGLTNHNEPAFDSQCKCGSPVSVEYSYKRKKYEAMT